MGTFRKRLTFANVVSCLALFVALGGASYAAINLPKNSVGSKQLKKNSVTSAKVKNHSLKAVDFKAGQLPAGREGPQGPTGEPGPFPSVLPSGKTVVGAFDASIVASAGGQSVTSQVSYPFPAPGQEAIYVKEEATNSICTGSSAHPTAPPGFTCVYERHETNIDLAGINYKSEEAGFGIYAFSSSPGYAELNGSWAATGK